MIRNKTMKKRKKSRKYKKCSGPITIKNFKKETPICCYDRASRTQLSVLDSHLHLRPFGGKPIEFKKFLNILRDSGIIFVQGEGIGQRLPINSSCTYYLDCPGVSVKPSIKSDMYNAQAILDNDMTDLNINLSMTFPDLDKPETILDGMRLLEKEYPGMFRWMGEVNLVKQAIFKNGHKPVPIHKIKHWKPFMKELYEKKYPISIHCDIGNDNEQFKYLPLMLEVLKLYPKNKIVWMHLGLSKQLKNVNVKEHTELLEKLLKENPNLYFDISWNVLYKQVFYDPVKRKPYIELINKYPDRFLPGTDFIAAVNHTDKNYKSDLKETSSILKELNDDAFRKIALGQNYFDLSRSKYKAPPIC